MDENITRTSMLLAALICSYVLLQCYANNRAFNQYCDSASTASTFNAFNASAALAVLIFFVWKMRPR